MLSIPSLILIGYCFLSSTELQQQSSLPKLFLEWYSCGCLSTYWRMNFASRWRNGWLLLASADVCICFKCFRIAQVTRVKEIAPRNTGIEWAQCWIQPYFASFQLSCEVFDVSHSHSICIPGCAMSKAGHSIHSARVDPVYENGRVIGQTFVHNSQNLTMRCGWIKVFSIALLAHEYKLRLYKYDGRTEGAGVTEMSGVHISVKRSVLSSAPPHIYILPVFDDHGYALCHVV